MESYHVDVHPFDIHGVMTHLARNGARRVRNRLLDQRFTHSVLPGFPAF